MQPAPLPPDFDVGACMRQFDALLGDALTHTVLADANAALTVA